MQGLIPFPSKPRFYCVTKNPTKGVEVAVFRVERTKVIGYEQPPFTQQGTFLKAKGMLSQISHSRRLGLHPWELSLINRESIGYLTAGAAGNATDKMTAIESFTNSHSPQHFV